MTKISEQFYENEIDLINTFRTYEELFEFFRANEHLLNHAFLQSYELCYFKADDADSQRFFKGLLNEIKKLFNRKVVIEFVNLDADLAHKYFVTNYRQLINETTIDFFPQIIAQVSGNKDVQTLVILKELMLTQLAASHFLFEGDRSYRYHVMLNGFSWLNKSAARDEFANALAHQDALKERVSFLSEMVDQCRIEGAAAYLYNNELGSILQSITKTSAEESIHLSETVLEIIGDEQPELTALLYANIGNQLRALDIHNNSHVFWHAVFAYRKAINSYTVLNDAEGLAQCSRSLGEILIETAFGEPVENRVSAIQSLERALGFFTQERDFNIWARINYELGDLYRQFKNEQYSETIESCINAYLNALTYYSKEEHTELFGDIKNSLGTIYLERIKGDPAGNIEIAIAALEEARKVINPLSEPNKWAVTANNLGKAYNMRLIGRKSDNQEAAKRYYEEALAIPGEPIDISVALQNLGCLYANRIAGDKNSNLEKAKGLLEDALKIREEDSFPEERGSTLVNLGAMMLERLSGNRSENVESAIQYESQAGNIFLRRKMTVNWALVQRNLSSIYSQRFRGDKAENIEKSIEAAENALTIYTVNNFPRDWAEVQKTLALSYSKRLRGNSGQNIEWALTAIENALQIFTEECYPEEWAHCLSIKGNILIHCQPADIESALFVFLTSAKFYKDAGDNIKWAQVQHDLGIAYYRREQGSRSDNLELAIKALNDVITVYNNDYFRETRSNAYNILGTIFSERIEGDVSENIDKAIEHYRASLTIRTLEEFPLQRRDTAWNLGNLLYKLNRFSEAAEIFISAHAAIQATRNESRNIESLGRIAQENAHVYRKLVTCCLKTGEAEDAAKYALWGKSRTLSEQMGDRRTIQHLKTDIPGLSEDFRQLEQKQQVLDEALSLSRYERESGRLACGELDIFLEKQETAIMRYRLDISHGLNELLFKYPQLSAFQNPPDFSMKDLTSLLISLNGTTMIEYVEHDKGYVAFIFSAGPTQCIELAANLKDLLIDSAENIVADRFWLLSTVDQSLRQMHKLLIDPLERHLPPDGPIVIAPTGFLHLLPFQAFKDRNGQYLVDHYAITFIPSADTLLMISERLKKNGCDTRKMDSILTVANSGYGERYIPNTILEVNAIGRCFSEVYCLHEESATAENIISIINDKKFDTVHFSCHGCYIMETPELSGLVIANENILTVNEIRTQLRFAGAPLVSLSACQTGQLKPALGDESIGIAWAFLTAGASAVLASQWSVPDLATRMLFENFYNKRKHTDMSNAECLRAAIIELRSMHMNAQPSAWAAFHTIGMPC